LRYRAYGLEEPAGRWWGGKILIRMQLYALTSSQLPNETLDLFLTREAAQRARGPRWFPAVGESELFRHLGRWSSVAARVVRVGR